MFFILAAPRSFLIWLGSMQSSGFCLSAVWGFSSEHAPSLQDCIPAAGSLWLYHHCCLPCAGWQDVLLAKMLRSFGGRKDLCIRFRPLMLPAVARRGEAGSPSLSCGHRVYAVNEGCNFLCCLALVRLATFVGQDGVTDVEAQARERLFLLFFLSQ